MLSRQVLLFLVVGGGQYLLDSILLYVLVQLGVMVGVANILSRASAAVSGYLLNARFTFSYKEVHDPMTILRFVILWIVLTTLSTLLLLGVRGHMGYVRFSPEKAFLSKLLIEAFLVGVSFLFTKLWVFADQARQ